MGQLGGIFIMGPGNICEYQYICNYLGEIPDMNEVLNASLGIKSNNIE